MPPTDAVAEFRRDWLPHTTDAGLERVTALLEKASPLLIHGAFTRAVPMGCLATQIAWNHPETTGYEHEAGVMWLCRVARLNPATSALILAWDAGGVGDYELRQGLLAACREEQERRACAEAHEAELAFC